MNDPEWRRMRRVMTWGILGLFVLVGVSIVASLVFYASQPSATFRPFFPFGWLGGLFFIFVAFWLVKWLFWPGEGTTHHDTGDTVTMHTTYCGKDTPGERLRRNNSNR